MHSHSIQLNFQLFEIKLCTMIMHTLIAYPSSFIYAETIFYKAIHSSLAAIIFFGLNLCV